MVNFFLPCNIITSSYPGNFLFLLILDSKFFRCLRISACTFLRWNEFILQTNTNFGMIPMLRQMKENLIGSSLFFSFDIDNTEPPCKGVFSNESDPLEYLRTELLPLLSCRIPKISIIRYFNNSDDKFYDQFLVPILSQQKVMDTSRVEIEK